jgi:pyruvate dehydrogenase E2 component (dihydrolipoamide acetyltransferase)
MPSLGADMEAGTLVEWLRKPGDRVRRGDVIAVVETQKGAIEIEVFQAGTIDALLAQPGQKLPVGAAMAFIRGEGEEAAPRERARVAPPVAAAPAAPPTAVASARGGEGGRVSPAARKRAAELGVDLAGLTGTGPQGAVSVADVEAAAQAAAPADGMREVIGAAMARSKREIPHYYLGHTIDLEAALRWLEAENLKRTVAERILHGALLLQAVALTLRAYPEFNGHCVGGRFKPSERVHLGVAISLRQGGLIAPAIHDANQLPLAGLMASLRDLVRRARTGGLRSSELSDPTITVTSLGEQGTESVFPVIYPPQVAIVGFGAVTRRPWIAADRIEPRRVIFCSLAADHRVSDGHRGGRFLYAVAQRLQEPQAP